MSLEIGGTVSGEIVEITTDGVLVSLPEDQSGWVPSCESLPAEILSAQFRIGERVTVKLVSQEEDGRFSLSILPPKEGLKSTDMFDKEFHRLNHVLNSRSSKFPLARVQHDRSVEESIEEWIDQVEKGLSRLHKHRGKRLSKEFYTPKE